MDAITKLNVWCSHEAGRKYSLTYLGERWSCTVTSNGKTLAWQCGDTKEQAAATAVGAMRMMGL